MSRLRGTPHFIALGVAAGAFTSFTPFMGFHFLIAALLAWTLGGSMLASALGTFVGNPVTFPLIWFASFKIGSEITGFTGKFDLKILRDGFEQIWDGMVALSGDEAVKGLEVIWPYFKPMLLGGILLGALVALLIYFPARRAVVAYQTRRDMRLRLHRQSVEARRAAEQAPSYAQMDNVHDLDAVRQQRRDGAPDPSPNSDPSPPKDVISGR